MNKLIKVAVTAACLSGAHAAFALPPGSYNNGVGIEHESHLSGATAQDRLIEAVVRVGAGAGVVNLCAANTLDRYTALVPNIDGVAGNVTVRAYTCSTANAIGGNIAAGSELFLHKEAGGSAKGFTPFGPAPADTRRFLSLDWVKANPVRCPAGAATPINGTLSAMGNYNCGTLTAADVAAGAVVDRLPNAGISDVDGNAIVDPEVDDATLGTVLEAPRNALVFGIAVTEKLRNALQQVQGLTAGDDSEAQMPSFSTAQLRGMFTSSNATKTQVGQHLVDSAGTALNASLTVTDPPAVSTLFLCRRAVSSGTQASFATHYLGEGCYAGAPTFVGPANSGSYVLGSTARVFSGTGSGDVTACLTDRNTNDRWAVGIVTTELEGAPGAGWRFVKVDDYAPTLLNTVAGNYPHFAEQVVVTGGVGSAAPFTAQPADDQDIVNYLIDNLGSIPLIRAVNDAFDAPFHPWGDGGYLALRPVGAAPVNTLIANQGGNPTIAGVQLHPQLRASRLGKGCAYPQLEVQTPAINGVP